MPQTRRNRDDRTLHIRYAGPEEPQPRRPLPLPAHDFLVMASHPLMLAENPPAPHDALTKGSSRGLF